MSECMMDFPHNPLWCAACYEENQRAQLIVGQRKANELKEWELGIREEELELRQSNKWVESKLRKPATQASYTPPTKQATPTIPGGMNIEPRRNT